MRMKVLMLACAALVAGVGLAKGEEAAVRAVAVVHPTEGSEARGVVEFEKTDAGVLIVATIHGLEPNQKHGFHIHKWGDCSHPAAQSAGGHFNPTDMPHGAPEDQEGHVGDLGNIEADENGVERYRRVDTHLSFAGNESIIGRAVVVHQNEDDLTSQPTGNAGPRLGCGVIGLAEKE